MESKATIEFTLHWIPWNSVKGESGKMALAAHRPTKDMRPRQRSETTKAKISQRHWDARHRDRRVRPGKLLVSGVSDCCVECTVRSQSLGALPKFVGVGAGSPTEVGPTLCISEASRSPKAHADGPWTEDGNGSNRKPGARHDCEDDSEGQ